MSALLLGGEEIAHTCALPSMSHCRTETAQVLPFAHIHLRNGHCRTGYLSRNLISC